VYRKVFKLLQQSFVPAHDERVEDLSHIGAVHADEFRAYGASSAVVSQRGGAEPAAGVRNTGVQFARTDVESKATSKREIDREPGESPAKTKQRLEENKSEYTDGECVLSPSSSSFSLSSSSSSSSSSLLSSCNSTDSNPSISAREDNAAAAAPSSSLHTYKTAAAASIYMSSMLMDLQNRLAAVQSGGGDPLEVLRKTANKITLLLLNPDLFDPKLHMHFDKATQPVDLRTCQLFSDRGDRLDSQPVDDIEDEGCRVWIQLLSLLHISAANPNRPSDYGFLNEKVRFFLFFF
jgi:hypothetical protein